MNAAKVFHTETHAPTLVVVPLVNVSSLGGEHVQPELERVLGEVTQPQIRHVVIDFIKVEYFGSVMLAAAQVIWKRVRAGQGQMALCNVSPVAREVLQISKFDQIWPIFDTRQQALDTLRLQAQ